MTPQQVADYFGTQTKIAEALGLTQASVSDWFTNNRIPEGRQYQIEMATNGRLRADKPALRKTA